MRGNVATLFVASVGRRKDPITRGMVRYGMVLVSWSGLVWSGAGIMVCYGMVCMVRYGKVHLCKLFPRGHLSLLVLLAAGQQEARWYTTIHLSPPAELRGACSGHTK